MERLRRLLKFTGWEEKELLKYCVHLSPKTGHETAVRLLNNRYGNPHYSLASYRKETKTLASINLVMLLVLESSIVLC